MSARCPPWDPKDGELCLVMVKPWENAVEAGGNLDVQMVLSEQGLGVKGQSNPLVAGFCPSFPQDSWGRESVRIRLSVMWLLSGKAMHERHYGDSVSPQPILKL